MALNTYGLKVEPGFLKNNQLKILADIENNFEDTLETEGLEIFVPNLPASAPDTVVLLRQAVKYLGYLKPICESLQESLHMNRAKHLEIH